MSKITGVVFTGILFLLLVMESWSLDPNPVTHNEILQYILMIGTFLSTLLTIIVWEFFGWLDDVRKELARTRPDEVDYVD